MTPKKNHLGPNMNPAHAGSPVMSPTGRQHSTFQNDVLHAKEEGRELPLLPWKNLVKTRPAANEKLWGWKSQSRIPLNEERRKPNQTQIFPKFRQKMNHALNSIRLLNGLKTAVSSSVENSMGGVMHKYRSGESPPRNRLGRQWERIRRSDVSDKDQEGIKLELKELLNTITNRSSENKKPDEEEWSDEVTSLPRVAFALPKNLLMDSTTQGSRFKVSRYHCHKFVPSCAKYASLQRKHHAHKSPTSELVNFLLMLHSNYTKSAPKGAIAEPDDDYSCYNDDQAYDDEDDEDEEDDGVDFGNPFQELKLMTTTSSPTAGSMTPAPWIQPITCSLCSSPSTICANTPGTTCPTPIKTTTTCQAPVTKKTDPTLSPAQLSSAQCKAYYQSLIARKDVTEEKNFFGELRLVTKATPAPSSWTENLEPKKNDEKASRSAVELNGGIVKLCSCNLGATLDSTVTTPSKPATTMSPPSASAESMTTASVSAASCEIHTTTDSAASKVTSSTTVQQPLKVQTYPCAITTCEPARTTLPPMTQRHEVLSMAPQPRVSGPPPCGVTRAVKHVKMDNHVHSNKDTYSTLNKKRASLRRNGEPSKSSQRHKIKHQPPDMPYHRRRYRHRQKPIKRRPISDDQTGLLAILADPSMPGAMKNGLWRYIPYKMVHLQDVKNPIEIKRGVSRDLDRVKLYRDQPNLVRPLKKKSLRRILLRDEPKYRRRYQEPGRSSSDNDYDYGGYKSYADENYGNGP